MVSIKLLDELKRIDLQEVNIVLISTTAKTSDENRLLPPHSINDKECLNIILNDERVVEEILSYLDKKSRCFFIDVERKQEINLWKIACRVIKKGSVFPYKPNDITRESAYFLMLQYFNYQLQQKNILIYGTGNIATKLALYLAEHEANVSLYGRNTEKLHLLKDSLNAILPAHSSTQITLHSDAKKYDSLVTVLSTENYVDERLISQLNERALVVDIGINNLTPGFIRSSREKSINIYRLDVRIGSPLLEATLQIHLNSFLTNNAGYKKLNGISCVAGGVIGDEGALILDSISKPQRVIGIANGTGGVKKYEEYTEADLGNLNNFKALL